MTTQVPHNLLETPYRKNIIINGNLDVWQRGTSFAAAPTGIFCADRFQYVKSGTVVHSVSGSVDVPTYAESGIKSYLSILCNVTTADASLTGTDYSAITYSLEGYDYARLVGDNATLSFWVKGTKTGTHCIGFRNGASDRSYVAEYSILVTDTWEKKTITVPLTESTGTWDYTNGKGMTIFFTMGAAATLQTTANTWQTGNFIATSAQANALDSTSNNFRIAQVQLEKGDTATGLESRNFGEELSLCQRYYEKSYNYATTPGSATFTGCLYEGVTRNAATATIGFSFNTQKRAQPVIVIYSPSTGAAGYIDNATDKVSTGQNIGWHGVRWVAVTGGVSSSSCNYHWTADAEI